MEISENEKKNTNDLERDIQNFIYANFLNTNFRSFSSKPLYDLLISEFETISHATQNSNFLLIEGKHGKTNLLNMYLEFKLWSKLYENSSTTKRLEKQQQKDAERLNNIEDRIKYSIQPAMAQFSKLLENYPQKDSKPAASSANYEWDSQIETILKKMNSMLENFDDLDIRLDNYTEIVKDLKNLVELARAMQNNLTRDAVLLIHDALCGVYSENLTRNQIKSLKIEMDLLPNLIWSRKEVENLDQRLNENKFETVPSDRFMRTRK